MTRNTSKTITREKIMQAAVRQFAENGYDGASIQSIVEEAEVAHGTIFWHFGNKEKLYNEVARWAGNEMYNALRPEVERDGPPPSLTELAEIQYRYLKSHPHIARLSFAITFEATGPHPELISAMRLFSRRATDIWRQWTFRCQELGLLREGFDPVVVGTFIATTLGSVHIGSRIHQWESATVHFDTIQRILMSGCFRFGPGNDLPDTTVEPGAAKTAGLRKIA